MIDRCDTINRIFKTLSIRKKKEAMHFNEINSAGFRGKANARMDCLVSHHLFLLYTFANSQV